MKIRPRTNIGSLDCEITPLLMEGEERDVDDSIGRRLVSLGIAIELEEPEPELKPEPTPEPEPEPEPEEPTPVPVVRAIPDEPAIARAKAPDIAPARTAIQQYRKKPVSIQNRKHKDK